MSRCIVDGDTCRYFAACGTVSTSVSITGFIVGLLEGRQDRLKRCLLVHGDARVLHTVYVNIRVTQKGFFDRAFRILGVSRSISRRVMGTKMGTILGFLG